MSNAEIPPRQSRQIALLALLFEGILASISVIWMYYRELEFQLTASALAWGSVPVVVLGMFLFQRCLLIAVWKFPSRFAATRAWLSEVILPFCAMVRSVDAWIISIAAGVGEELFLRGVLQQECGVLLSSALFSLIHFGSTPHRYLGLVSGYFIISLIFAYQYEITGSLGVVIVTHALYDVVAIIYLRRNSTRIESYFEG